MKVVHWFRIALPLFFFPALAACGKNPALQVKDVSVKAYVEKNDLYASFLASIDSSAIALPSFYLRVPDPRNPFESIGTVGLKPGSLKGQSVLSLSVDVTRAIAEIGLPGDPEALLPNGLSLPFSTPNNESIARIRIGSGAVFVYVGVSGPNVVLGSTVSIRELDRIGSSLGGFPTSWFMPFAIASGVQGSAGLFLGRSGQNGIGLFTSVGIADASVHSISQENTITWMNQSPKSKSLNQIQSGLIQLNNAKTKTSLSR